MNALLTAAVTVQGYLADGGDSPSDVDPTTGKGPEWGEAAPVGLLVIVLLCVAVYFLVKSMNRNLKKVPESFATVGAPVGAAGDAGGAGDTPSSGSASAAGAVPGSVDVAAVRTEKKSSGPDTGPATPTDPS